MHDELAVLTHRFVVNHRVFKLYVCASVVFSFFQGKNHLAEGGSYCGDYSWCDGIFCLNDRIFPIM